MFRSTFIGSLFNGRASRGRSCSPASRHSTFGRSFRRRLGHTLLELIAASTLVSIAVTVTMSLMRQSLELSHETEKRNMLVTLAVSKMEEHLATTSRNFVEADVTGDFNADGYSDCRFRVVKSSQTSDGGIPDQLMAITVTVWCDFDGDQSADAGELVVTLRSKLAKITAWNLL